MDRNPNLASSTLCADADSHFEKENVEVVELSIRLAYAKVE